MYTKDKTHRITLRLNEPLFNFVSSQAQVLDVSPSEFLRMVITSVYVQQDMEEVRRENEQTNINNSISV